MFNAFLNRLTRRRVRFSAIQVQDGSSWALRKVSTSSFPPCYVASGLSFLLLHLRPICPSNLFILTLFYTFPNHDQTYDANETRKVAINDHQANNAYPNNRISNTKYTIITFLPKNLLEQFGYVIVSLRCSPSLCFQVRWSAWPFPESI